MARSTLAFCLFAAAAALFQGRLPAAAGSGAVATGRATGSPAEAAAPPPGGGSGPVAAAASGAGAAGRRDTHRAPRPLVVPRVEVRDLVSAVNDVHYELRVALPHGYGEPARRFPVVYTLDADYSFLVARAIVDHLSEREHLAEVVVVGVAYGGPLRYREHRTRDYTPTFVPDGGYGPEYQRVSGGAPGFLEALATEIVPFVDRQYRTVRADRTLVGHSYGGLFTLWTMLTRPGLFDNYVAVSPSIWYDDRLLLRLEQAPDGPPLSGRAYLCAGSREDPRMPGDLLRLAAQLERRPESGFAFASLVMENETHNSIFPGCLSNGLRFVLRGR